MISWLLLWMQLWSASSGIELEIGTVETADLILIKIASMKSPLVSNPWSKHVDQMIGESPHARFCAEIACP